MLDPTLEIVGNSLVKYFRYKIDGGDALHHLYQMADVDVAAINERLYCFRIRYHDLGRVEQLICRLLVEAKSHCKCSTNTAFYNGSRVNLDDMASRTNSYFYDSVVIGLGVVRSISVARELG
eukprot:4992774-Ditylum_brightwellii.AAC.1